MNKQELIKHFEEMEYVSIHQMGKKSFIDLIEKLDEPQKVTVPQFVADYIKDAKYYEWDLDDVFDHITEESGGSEISEWFYTLGNVDVFARAWLDGYEIEKEKRYLVKMKGISSLFRHLKYNLLTEKWYMGNDTENEEVKKTHTRKEIEDAGFGWVFDCPGIEIKEVTE